MGMRLTPIQPREAPLSVVDMTSARVDLAERREVKFAIPGADVGKLRSILASNCRRLVHNKPVSLVHSIYFDDPSLSTCRANLDGVGERRKLRIRWYDTPRPETDAYLEIKWRDNRVTGKHRLNLRARDPLHRLTYRGLIQLLSDALPDRYRLVLTRYPEPVLMVRYRREHYATRDGAIRLTLDYDLTYFDQLGRQAISTEFPCRFDDFVVLEGKVGVGRDADLRRVLYPLAVRATRCSKYVHGCRLLGHISSHE